MWTRGSDDAFPRSVKRRRVSFPPMRLAALALVLLLLPTPVALAGWVGCWLLPPGAFPGAGGCTRTFVVGGAGSIVVTVETLFGSVGEVAIHGQGPAGSQVVASCTLGYSAGTCTPALALLGPRPGTWTFTGATTNANVVGSDSRVWMGITYP